MFLHLKIVFNSYVPVWNIEDKDISQNKKKSYETIQNLTNNLERELKRQSNIHKMQSIEETTRAEKVKSELVSYN